MQVKNEFSFVAPLETVKLKHVTTAVYLPHHVIIDLPKGRLRVSGTINGFPFSLAIQYRRDGSRFFTVGSGLRRDAGIVAGDHVNVSFKILSLKNVEVPSPLDSAINQESEVRKIGRKFSKNVKYDFMNYIHDVKNMDVRIRRSIEKIQRGKIAAPQPQQNRKNRNK